MRLRTAAVNAVRGLTKSCGYRMPASATTCFAQRSLAVMPPGLAHALGPVLQQIDELSQRVAKCSLSVGALAVGAGAFGAAAIGAVAIGALALRGTP